MTAAKIRSGRATVCVGRPDCYQPIPAAVAS